MTLRALQVVYLVGYKNYMNPQTSSTASQTNPALVAAITKSLAYTENGGAPNLSDPSAGKSGEMASIFQFEPGTWKNYSQQVFGNDTTPMNNDTETAVVMNKVQNWLQQGLTPQQIFSSWNAGPGEPNAYTGKFSDGSSSTGTNKYGVKYSVPQYVDTAMKYLSEFGPQLSSQLAMSQSTPTSPQVAGAPQTPNANPPMSAPSAPPVATSQPTPPQAPPQTPSTSPAPFTPPPQTNPGLLASANTPATGMPTLSPIQTKKKKKQT